MSGSPSGIPPFRSARLWSGRRPACTFNLSGSLLVLAACSDRAGLPHMGCCPVALRRRLHHPGVRRRSRRPAARPALEHQVGSQLRLRLRPPQQQRQQVLRDQSVSVQAKIGAQFVLRALLANQWGQPPTGCPTPWLLALVLGVLCKWHVDRSQEAL